MRISREHFGHRSGSASHTFLINSRHFLEGMRRGSWAETSIISTASPSACTSSSACLARPPKQKRPQDGSDSEKPRESPGGLCRETQGWPGPALEPFTEARINAPRLNAFSRRLSGLRRESLTCCEAFSGPRPA